jgi:uncharacterized protein YxjI
MRGSVTTSSVQPLLAYSGFIVQQQIEPIEYFGIESRNKYVIRDFNQTPILYAGQPSGGFWDEVAMQIAGQDRTFTFAVVDNSGNCVLRANHPLRFLIREMDVYSGNGRPLGKLKQNVTFWTPEIDIRTPNGELLFVAKGSLFAFEFQIVRNGLVEAHVSKIFDGFAKEAFTDADTFMLRFNNPRLTADERALILMNVLMIDLIAFEQKAT